MAKKIKELDPFNADDRARYVGSRSHLYALCAASSSFHLLTNSDHSHYWVTDGFGGSFDAKGWNDDEQDGSPISAAELREKIEAGSLCDFSKGESEAIHQDIMHILRSAPLPF